MNPRSAWTDTRGSGAPMPSPEAGGSLLHYNGPPMKIRYHQDCLSLLRGIRNYHTKDNGWADIAYSYAACPHGEAYILRGPGVRTAANGTTRCNDRHHAVLLMLGDGEEVTDGHIRAARESVAHARKHGKAGNHIGPHSQCKSTPCPGDAVRKLIREGRFEPNQPDEEDDEMRPVVGIWANPGGKGYWIVGRDGGVFAASGAGFYGSMGGENLAEPIVDFAPTSTGKGYYMIGADGGVFAFGDAKYAGRVVVKDDRLHWRSR